MRRGQEVGNQAAGGLQAFFHGPDAGGGRDGAPGGWFPDGASELDVLPVGRRLPRPWDGAG